METFKLQLITEQQEPLELCFHDCKNISSNLNLSDVDSLYVFCDAKYSAKVYSTEKINNITLLLNGNEIQSEFNPNNQSIFFRDESFGERIFQECFGYVQIIAIYEDSHNLHKVESNYIPVMVKKSLQNDSISRMIDFVYKNNPNLLYGKPISKNTSNLKDFAEKTIESNIKLLANILRTYENNYCYFKANSRFKTEPNEIVNDFEKLQYISTNTLQYIVTHPEQLQKTNSHKAIKIGQSYYLPQKTLIVNSKKTYDIIENRIIVSFLKLLLTEIELIKQELYLLEQKIPHKRIETKEYILSTLFIYKNITTIIKIIIDKVNTLHQKINDLYSAYAKILPISEINITGIPFMSHIFRAIPQYHQIYNCIEAWFLKGAFSLDKEKFILSFIKTSQLYEVYILSKINSFISKSGYTLESSEKIIYPKPLRSLYENTTCNNCFKYKKENSSTKATLYYQPVIYKNDMQHIAGIGLYRNTSISFPKKNDYYGAFSQTGTYYTPDYIIKIEKENDPQVKYIIADAKLSRTRTVKTRHAVEVIYKYLFSVSPLHANSSISSLFIFNGFLDDDQKQDGICPIRDFDLSNSIQPRAEIISLTENEVGNDKLHDLILRHSIGGETYKSFIDTFSENNKNDNDAKESTRENTSTISSPQANEVNQTTHHIEKKDKQPKIKTSIKLADLLQNKQDINRFKAMGYTTIEEILPTRTKKEFNECKLFDRAIKRKIEGKLRQKNYFL